LICNYTGAAADALWIIDSASNREWFGRNGPAIHPNSAVFAPDSNPISIIDHVFTHHPTWTAIEVQGRQLTPEMAEEFRHLASIRETQTGFNLSRL
jgi:hypothetical protein